MKSKFELNSYDDLELALVKAVHEYEKKIEDLNDEIEKLNKINDHLVSQLMHSFDFIQ